MFKERGWNMRKKLLSIGIFLLIMMPILAIAALPVYAQTNASNILWGGLENNISTAIGLGNRDPREVAGSIINVFLGFLGIIAVVIILLGGFKWMTAGGNEDGVAEAKKLITAGVIGLVIILMSWALASFVVNQLYNATS